MKVLWVNPSFLDYRIPLYEELNRLLNGHFHLVYGASLIPKRCDDRVRGVLGANAHSVQARRISFGITGMSNRGVRISVTSGICKTIKSINPDLIIAEGFFQFTPWALFSTLRHHVPLMIAYERTAHTERHAQWYRRAYRRLISRFVSGYIANGRLTKEYLESWGVSGDTIFTGGMCADSFELAQHSNAVDAAERERLRSALGATRDGLVYVFVGRLIELKGLKYLIDAWQQHISTHSADCLLIVGSGPLDGELRGQAADIPSVFFTGAVDYGNIYQYYAASDVFVIPTLEDNWSLVVPEAMACGLPIACSIYNGCWPELVQHDVNGTTFDPLRIETIVDALDYFHHKNLDEMGAASVRIESDFSPTRTAEKILEAVNATLARKTK